MKNCSSISNPNTSLNLKTPKKRTKTTKTITVSDSRVLWSLRIDWRESLPGTTTGKASLVIRIHSCLLNGSLRWGLSLLKLRPKPTQTQRGPIRRPLMLQLMPISANLVLTPGLVMVPETVANPPALMDLPSASTSEISVGVVLEETSPAGLSRGRVASQQSPLPFHPTTPS